MNEWKATNEIRIYGIVVIRRVLLGLGGLQTMSSGGRCRLFNNYCTRNIMSMFGSQDAPHHLVIQSFNRSLTGRMMVVTGVDR